MNLPRCCADKVLVVTYVIGALGTLLIMAVLVNFMHRYTRPEPITQTQADQRRKNLADIRTTSSNEVETVAQREQPKNNASMTVYAGTDRKVNARNTLTRP